MCLFVETAPSNQSLFMLQFLAGDSAFVTDHKRQLAKLLTGALASRRRVNVQHEAGQAVVRGIDFLPPNISPVRPAVQGDCYSITGSGIPNAAQVVFETGVSTVTVTPDLRRPSRKLARAGGPARRADVPKFRDRLRAKILR